MHADSSHRESIACSIAAISSRLRYDFSDVALAKYGRYEAIHLIASGGMASVYLGRTRGAGGFERLVALKVMHEHIAHDPEFGGMFLDEARLAAKIRHPNVVPTLDVADDGSYIVMEYVEGASLHAILSRLRKLGERLPLDVALRIFMDAMTGLHAAHELTSRKGKPLGIVHRDVSPHNILVGVDGASRITDFGIAYAEARITSTRGGQLKGKLPYMAPEQLEDGTVDRRTDVYAAGCVLWEMLSGQRLFGGSNEAAIACAVLAGPETSLRDVVTDVPEELNEACMMALRSIDSRFMSALAFVDAVEAAADASGIRPAKPRVVGKFAREGQTYPAPASLISSGHTPTSPPNDSLPPTRRLDEAAEQGPVTEALPQPTPPESDGDTTMVSIDESVPRIAGSTTTEDRPPPEVAEVIKAAYDRLAEEDRVKSGTHSLPPELLDDGPVVSSIAGVPKKRGGGTWVVVALVALATVAGVYMLLREDASQSATPAASATAVASASASASVAPTPAPAIDPTTPPVESTEPSKPSATPARPPAPRPWIVPKAPRPQPAKPAPVPSGFHPATP